jgi:hypothetical protein
MDGDQPGPAGEGDDHFAERDRGAGAAPKAPIPPSRMDEKPPVGKRLREENKEEMNRKRTHKPWVTPL